MPYAFLQRRSSCIGSDVSGPAAAFPIERDVLIELGTNPATASDHRLSDHAPVALKLRDRTQPEGLNSIPEHVTRDPRYPEVLRKYVDAAGLDKFPPVQKWRRVGATD